MHEMRRPGRKKCVIGSWRHVFLVSSLWNCYNYLHTWTKKKNLFFPCGTRFLLEGTRIKQLPIWLGPSAVRASLIMDGWGEKKPCITLLTGTMLKNGWKKRVKSSNHWRTSFSFLLFVGSSFAGSPGDFTDESSYSANRTDLTVLAGKRLHLHRITLEKNRDDTLLQYNENPV